MRRWGFAAVWLAFVGVVIWLADTHQARWLFHWIDVHPGSDKLGHFILIGAMAFFLCLALNGRKLGLLSLSALLVAIVFLGEEISQIFIPGRHFDLGDLAADLAGINVFDWLARRFLRIRREV